MGADDKSIVVSIDWSKKKDDGEDESKAATKRDRFGSSFALSSQKETICVSWLLK